MTHPDERQAVDKIDPERQEIARRNIARLRNILRPNALNDNGVSATPAVDHDPLRMSYEMELAAHRETTAALVASKDATIAAQQELIATLQHALAQHRDHTA